MQEVGIYSRKIDSGLKRPRSRTYKWCIVPDRWLHWQGRREATDASSLLWILVARWMQRRHEECTTAISTKAKKESEGPSYFHLFKNTNSHITILAQKQTLLWWNCGGRFSGHILCIMIQSHNPTLTFDEIVEKDSQGTGFKVPDTRPSNLHVTKSNLTKI